MTPPFRPSTSTAAVPRGCGGDRCASGRDAWPLHHVRHEGVFCRLCSSCVLLYHPSAYCSSCLLLVPPFAGAGDPRVDPAVAPPGPTVACSDCGLSVAHLTCLQGDPTSFLCPPCAAANDGRPFSLTPPVPIGGGARRALDDRAARVLLVAACLANDSVARAAVAAREEAERRVAEAAAARKRCREMLDAAFRALEAEAKEAAEKKEAKKPPVAPAQPNPPQPPKKKTPKSNEANRDRDKLLKLNAMQQPALAFAAAAAAAAAASSMPPSAKEEKKAVKQEAQGAAPREHRAPLFGALQS